jgi:hypothetical protein
MYGLLFLLVEAVWRRHDLSQFCQGITNLFSLTFLQILFHYNSVRKHPKVSRTAKSGCKML